MKKQIVQNKQPFKYLNPKQLKRQHLSHVKSMVDLDELITSAEQQNNNHHSSCYGNQNSQPHTIKSSSLSKLLHFVENRNTKHKKPLKQKQNRNVYLQNERSKQNGQNCILVEKMKKYIQHLKGKEKQYLDKIKDLQSLNEKLKINQFQVHNLLQQYQSREQQLKKKLKSLQKKHINNKCHEHDLIIQSLRKVVSEQLNKIIELQQYKLSHNQKIKIQQDQQQQDTQEIQHNSKLKEYFEKQSQPSSNRMYQKNTAFQTSFSIHNTHKQQQYITIQQQKQQNLETFQNQMQDGNILQEVDQYLSNWINKKK